MSLNKRTTLLIAADLLEEDAQAMFDSCKGQSMAWSCAGCRDTNDKCTARLNYEKRNRVAAAVKAIAERI